MLTAVDDQLGGDRRAGIAANANVRRFIAGLPGRTEAHGSNDNELTAQFPPPPSKLEFAKDRTFAKCQVPNAKCQMLTAAYDCQVPNANC